MREVRCYILEYRCSNYLLKRVTGTGLILFKILNPPHYSNHLKITQYEYHFLIHSYHAFVKAHISVLFCLSITDNLEECDRACFGYGSG